MGVSVDELRANVNTRPMDEHRSGTILRIRSDAAGPNKSGLEVITVEYDPHADPTFSARFTDMLGVNEVAQADSLDAILSAALEAANRKFIGEPLV